MVRSFLRWQVKTYPPAPMALFFRPLKPFAHSFGTSAADATMTKRSSSNSGSSINLAMNKSLSIRIVRRMLLNGRRSKQDGAVMQMVCRKSPFARRKIFPGRHVRAACHGWLASMEAAKGVHQFQPYHAVSSQAITGSAQLIKSITGSGFFNHGQVQ